MPNNREPRKGPSRQRRNNNNRSEAQSGPTAHVNRDATRNSIVNFRRSSYELNTTLYSTVNKGVITSTSAAEGLYAFSFALSDVADYTSYVSVWDVFRIREIVVTIVPLTLSSTPSAGPSYAFGYISPDFDDATTPANSAAMLSYATLAVLAPSDRYSFKFQPSVDIATTTSAAASVNGVFNKKSPWLDCSSPSVPHYGVKAAVTQSTSTNLTQWCIFARYVIDFKRQQ
jgi:hypothetical protein